MNTKINFMVLQFLCFIVVYGCNSNKRNEQAKESFIPVPINVFKPLDGTWQGKFYIYEDTLGQREGNAQPRNIGHEYLQSLPLKLKSTIEATHIYFSENPYLQKGEITDVSFDANGNKKIVKSSAINKVENGKLKCIVTKPNETVVHNGEYLGNNTIVWKRSLSNPVKIEYFQETVNNNHYKIIGWGYYGNDDPALTPRYWFYADYEKVE